ncbi:MAG: MFS transporter [Pseudomonadota bacterium]
MRSNRYFMLAVLTIVAVMNFVDRQILAILLESIKADLALSDLELGLLSGLVFAVFYALVGIPIARLADRWDRRKIISIALFFWSSMTVISGLAQSFVHLALARVGVGLGEGGVQPASHSFIAEKFAPKERATAFAIYSAGVTAGIFAALSIGGWANDVYGWRIAFFIAGVPGVVLAFVAYAALKETRTPHSFRLNMFVAGDGERTLLQSFNFFWRSKAWRYAGIAAVVTQIATLGINAWLPAFIIRSHGLSTAQTGFLMALLVGVAGTFGAVSGGLFADKLAKSRGIQWLPWTLGCTYAVVCVIAPTVFLMENITLLVVLLAPYTALLLTSSGVQFAIAQSVVKSDMRAMSSALLILLINLFGLGFGPLFVGALSDMFVSTSGAESLRYAMLCMTPLYFLGVFCFYKSGQHLPAEAVSEEVLEGAC